MVKYSAPESSRISLEDIVPTGWNIDYEYLSQPKEMYNPCYSSSSTGEIIIEDYIPKSPSEATDLEFTYLVNAILGEEQDQNIEEDDLESVSDNESLHSEHWKFPQKKNRHPPHGNGYAHPAQPAEVEEDRLSVAKTVVGKPRPPRGQLKPKVPEYLVRNGVRRH